MPGLKIELEKALFTRVKEHAEANGYSSPEEFVTHLIESALSPSSGKDEDPAKLKGIGYMDFGRDI